MFEIYIITIMIPIMKVELKGGRGGDYTLLLHFQCYPSFYTKKKILQKFKIKS
jgi:hypothetical protein